VQTIKEGSMHQERSYLSRSTSTSFGTRGASVIRKKEEEEENLRKGEACRKISAYTVYGTGMSIVLSLYPKKFGYRLGGYSHRERCRAPNRKRSSARRKVEADK
jgi:hypothetical protein